VLSHRVAARVLTAAAREFAREDHDAVALGHRAALDRRTRRARRLGSFCVLQHGGLRPRNALRLHIPSNLSVCVCAQLLLHNQSVFCITTSFRGVPPPDGQTRTRHHPPVGDRTNCTLTWVIMSHPWRQGTAAQARGHCSLPHSSPHRHAHVGWGRDRQPGLVCGRAAHRLHQGETAVLVGRGSRGGARASPQQAALTAVLHAGRSAMRPRCLHDERDRHARGWRCERGGSQGCDAREGLASHPWAPQHPTGESARKRRSRRPRQQGRRSSVGPVGRSHCRAPRRALGHAREVPAPPARQTGTRAGGGVGGAGRRAATRGRGSQATRGRRNIRRASRHERARRRRRPTRGSERAPRRGAGAGGWRAATRRRPAAGIDRVRLAARRDGPRARSAMRFLSSCRNYWVDEAMVGGRELEMEAAKTVRPVQRGGVPWCIAVWCTVMYRK